LDGGLEHKDSLGNREIIKRGDVQFTSAGTGIWHSEYNAATGKSNDDSDVVHFLQMWVIPSKKGLTPNYQTKHFEDSEKLGKLCKIVASTDTKEDNLVKINQDVTVYASILNKDQQVSHTFVPGRRGYVHVAMTNTGGSLKVSSANSPAVELGEGDGAFVTFPSSDSSSSNSNTLTLTGNGDKTTEFVFFDLQ